MRGKKLKTNLKSRKQFANAIEAQGYAAA